MTECLAARTHVGVQFCYAAYAPRDPSDPSDAHDARFVLRLATHAGREWGPSAGPRRRDGGARRGLRRVSRGRGRRGVWRADLGAGPRAGRALAALEAEADALDASALVTL